MRKELFNLSQIHFQIAEIRMLFPILGMKQVKLTQQLVYEELKYIISAWNDDY
jgi:hypothetical protein